MAFRAEAGAAALLGEESELRRSLLADAPPPGVEALAAELHELVLARAHEPAGSWRTQNWRLLEDRQPLIRLTLVVAARPLSSSAIICDSTREAPMGQVLVRDLPDEVVERLKAKATAEGRSLEAYLRRVLEDASALDRDEFIALADAVAATTRGRPQTDATDLIRRWRDAGWQ